MGDGLRPGRVRPSAARSARSPPSPHWFRSRTPCSTTSPPSRRRTPGSAPQVATSDYDRNRLAEFDGLTAAAEHARPGAGAGPRGRHRRRPSPSRARSPSTPARAPGVAPDQTVLNDDGLVGRVLRVTRTTATVLLDRRHRVGRSAAGSAPSMKVGFLRGRGGLGDDGRLDLELVDQTDVPAKGDTVVTWGSQDGAPYVSGVPIGRVDRGLRQPARDLAARGDRAVRRLRRPRPGRRRGAVGHRAATAASSRPTGACDEVTARCRWPVAAGRWSWSRWCSRSSLFPHLAWRGHRPQLLPARRRRAPRWSAARQFAAMLGFFAGAAARPRAAGRPRRRPLGARAGRRRLRRRADAPGHPTPTGGHGGRRRSRPSSFVGTSVYALIRAGAAATRWSASGDLLRSIAGRRAAGTCC